MIKNYCCGPFLTNTYLVTKGEDAVVIDPGLGFEIHAQEIINTYNVVGVLLTHGHLDHMDAIGKFKCPIYINKDELSFLQDESKALYPLMRLHRSYNLQDLEIKCVSDGDVIDFGSMKFKVIHTPGHTIGSSCYLFYDKLFSGDTLFCLSQGRTDFPTGSEKMMKESLKKIMKLCHDNTIVYPGHNEKTTIKFERQNNMFVINALK